MSSQKGLMIAVGLGVGVGALAIAASSKKAKAAAPPAQIPPPAPPPDEEPDDDEGPDEGEPMMPPRIEPPPPLPPELEVVVREPVPPPAPRPPPEPIMPPPAPVAPAPAPAPAPEVDDENEITPAEASFIRAVNAAVAAQIAKRPNHPGLQQLAELIREAHGSADPDQGVSTLRALVSTGLPPTVSTWCRAMGGKIPGITPHVDLDEAADDYPEAVRLVREICEFGPAPTVETVASVAPSAPSPAPAPRPAQPSPAPAAPPPPPAAPAPPPRPAPAAAPPPPAPAPAPAAAPPVDPAMLPPEGYDPVKARSLAKQVAANVQKKGCPGYSRDLVRDFQRFAGLVPDRIYGPGTKGALVHFGIKRPPPTCTKDKSTRPYKWADVEG